MWHLMLKTFINLVVPVLLIWITIVLFFKKKFCYWKNKNVYTEQPQIPFGNAYNVVRHKNSHAEEFQKLYNIFKSKNLQFGGYYAFFKPMFVPTDLDLIKNIMTTDFEHFMDHIAYVNEDVEPIGVNLITMKGWKWKRLRAKLTPTFTSVKMKSMFPTLLDCSKGLAKEFKKQMEDKGTTNVTDIIARYTSDVIGSCVFGLNCNSLENPEDPFRVVGKTFFDVSRSGNAIVQLLLFLTPGLLAFLRIPVIDKKVKEVFTDIVKNNVDYRVRNNIKRNDFLHSLIQITKGMKIKQDNMNPNLFTDDHPEEQLTMIQLIAQCLLFFLAGFETSSSTITFFLYELAVNNSIQDMLRLEVKQTLEEHNGKITYDALMKMTYMDQCIYETLRKYPVVPVHTRECTKPYRIPNSDVILDKGTYVMISVLGIHRDPEYYPKPERYDPERFSKSAVANRHPCAWFPFGAGPRTCIGERFGMLQIKVCLSMLLKKYRFKLNANTQKPLRFDEQSTVILAPERATLLDIEELVE